MAIFHGKQLLAPRGTAIGAVLALCLAAWLAAVAPARGEDGFIVAELTGDGTFRPKPQASDKPAGGLLKELVPVDPPGRSNRRPLGEFNSLTAPGLAMNDRGIDSADVKWRRQARLTGVRMRMLNGPELAYATDGYSSGTERGTRNYLGAVVPINNRWELAALDKFGSYQMKDGGRRAGIEALTLRIGANPSVSFRPWFSVTPYMGLWDGDGVGVGLAAGAEKTIGGISLAGRAFAFEPWDEGYDTVSQDGRRHGFQVSANVPIDRRLSILAVGGYEWLELGPNAPGGREYAGRRGTWMVRADWIALKRDGANMGYGFRDPTLWDEQLVPVELGLFGQVGGERYIRPNGFTTLNPTPRSLSERVGVFYNQAISPHLGFTAEAYIGQDNYRDIDFGRLYGGIARLHVVVNEHVKFWLGWGYDSSNTNMASGGGADRYYSFGCNINF